MTRQLTVPNQARLGQDYGRPSVTNDPSEAGIRGGKVHIPMACGATFA